MLLDKLNMVISGFYLYKFRDEQIAVDIHVNLNNTHRQVKGRVSELYWIYNCTVYCLYGHIYIITYTEYLMETKFVSVAFR